MARRRQEEFYCSTSGGGCEGYFLTWLRDDMNGNYTIECPNCEHHHFRVVKDGLVTGDRHSDQHGEATILVTSKATYKKEPYTNDPEFRRRQIRAYNPGAVNA
jgi:hypothetical protein